MLTAPFTKLQPFPLDRLIPHPPYADLNEARCSWSTNALAQSTAIQRIKVFWTFQGIGAHARGSRFH